MSEDQESDGSSDTLKKLWDHRPRMTYENLSLVFDEVGDLVIEQCDAGEVKGQVTIPMWQLELVLAFIKQHRLSPVQAGFATAFSRRRQGSSEPPVSE
jgi:hypothetical protein